MVVNVFTQPGDDVVIMPPVYHPFRIVPEENGRRVVNVPLKEDAGHRYHIDFDALENLETKGGLLILSNPHNPGGRMWTADELYRLADICKRKGLLVISDEIHADMALWSNRHVPFASINEAAASNSITFCAPSKTFNIPGLVSSWAIVRNPELRQPFYHWLEVNEFSAPTFTATVATEAAYNEGEPWLTELLEYLEGNVDATVKFVEENMPGVRAVRPQASFLVWLDFRGLGLTHDELIDGMQRKARLGLNDGAMFGKQGTGFMRLNVALPRAELMKCLSRMAEAFK